MKGSVVADSTCLIGLERAGALNILPALFDEVLIPPEVASEYGASHPWLKVDVPTDEALVAALKLSVDDGEAEAIALASERKVRIILDDRQARAVAQKLGLQVIGTLGCLLKAKQSGVVRAVKPMIERLEAEGFYMSGALRAEALRLAGE